MYMNKYRFSMQDLITFKELDHVLHPPFVTSKKIQIMISITTTISWQYFASKTSGFGLIIWYIGEIPLIFVSWYIWLFHLIYIVQHTPQVKSNHIIDDVPLVGMWIIIAQLARGQKYCSNYPLHIINTETFIWYSFTSK